MNLKEYIGEKMLSSSLPKQLDPITLIFGKKESPFKTEFGTQMFDDCFTNGQLFYKNILYYCSWNILNKNKYLFNSLKIETRIEQDEDDDWIIYIPKEVIDAIIKRYNQIISGDSRLENDRIGKWI